MSDHRRDEAPEPFWVERTAMEAVEKERDLAISRLAEATAPGFIGAFAARDHWKDEAARLERERDESRAAIQCEDCKMFRARLSLSLESAESMVARLTREKAALEERLAETRKDLYAEEQKRIDLRLELDEARVGRDGTWKRLSEMERENADLRARLQAAEDEAANRHWAYREDFAAAKAEGVREEREACAKVAEEHDEHIDFASPGGMGDPSPEEHEPVRCKVAAAIRARDTEGKEP